MAGLSTTHLFGDPELDRCVPINPRVIPETQWTSLDGGRIMAVGGLRPITFPRKAGAIELVDFLPLVDGNTPLAKLLAGEPDVVQDRTSILRMLFRCGLLEEPAVLQGEEVPASTQTFLAFSRDLTRLCRTRDEAISRVHGRIALVGAAPAWGEAMAAEGLNVMSISDAAEAADAELVIAWLDESGRHDALIDTLQRDGRLILLVAGRDDVLDIGPLISGSGYGDAADYRHATPGRPYLTPASDLALWGAMVAQTALLIITRSSPLPLTNKTARIAFDAEEGLSSTIVPIPKAGAAIARRLPALSEEGRTRLLRQARISVPPIHLAGTKMHEVHYARKNVAATQEIPVSANGPGSGRAAANRLVRPVAPVTWMDRLLEVLDAVFGYTRHLDGQLTRNCPSGGNLGTPECLVVLTSVRTGRESIYRFIPVDRRLELLVGDEPTPTESRGSGHRLTIAAIGNLEKAQRKYEEFGLNLAQLDAGVARAFLAQVAAACGFRVRPSRHRLPALEAIIADREHTCAITWQVELAATVSFHVGMWWQTRWRMFQRLARSRRALRRYAPVKLSAAAIARLVWQARPAEAMARQPDLTAALRPIVTVADPHPQAGTYELAGRSLKPLATGGRLPLHQHDEVIVQRALGEAPVRLFFFADLPRLLEAQGPTVHDALLQLMGEWAGRLWLDLEAVGHGGCPAGAASESEILSCLPADLRESTLLFTFVFGRKP